MKSTLLITLTTLLFTTGSLMAEDPHDHEGKIAGPNKGKVLEGDDYHLEFLILPDRRAAFYFYDEEMEPTPAEIGKITLTTGTRADMQKLEVAPEQGRQVSDGELPEGSENWAIIQVTSQEGGAKKTFRVRLDESACGSCDFLEYACICEGH